MAVQLLSLTFHHDFTEARRSALHLRLNATETVNIPEWIMGRLQQFPAAYAIEETLGANPVVEGQLAGPPASTVEISAVPALPGGTHVLGPIAATPVAFGMNGLAAPVRFRLASPLFALAGVGAHNVRWRWLQRQGPLDPWTTFAESEHRIYTVLRIPRDPWFQQPLPNAVQLPWAEVLEVACQWAAGTFAPQEAAAAITLALFSQGGERFRYSCATGAPTNYSFPEFDCSAFLERLSGGFGRGPNVNCTDCATIVSTLANVLGCELSQARMFNPLVPFAVNTVRLIGNFFFGAVCGAGVFNYHEVAWDGLCTEFEEVYDACLAVLVPAPPLYPIATVVPANSLFGFPNQGTYRDLLAAPASRLICQPQPSSRIRRSVY